MQYRWLIRSIWFFTIVFLSRSFLIAIKTQLSFQSLAFTSQYRLNLIYLKFLFPKNGSYIYIISALRSNLASSAEIVHLYLFSQFCFITNIKNLCLVLVFIIFKLKHFYLGTLSHLSSSRSISISSSRHFSIPLFFASLVFLIWVFSPTFLSFTFFSFFASISALCFNIHYREFII